MENLDIKILRTQQINNFMSSFDDLRSVDTLEIEEGLKKILGETPGVDFEYGVDHLVNETTGKDDRNVELKKIHVLYSYIDDDDKKPKIGKISYIVG
jgi:hypothetical protein